MKGRTNNSTYDVIISLLDPYEWMLWVLLVRNAVDSYQNNCMQLMHTYIHLKQELHVSKSGHVRHFWRIGFSLIDKFMMQE